MDKIPVAFDDMARRSGEWLRGSGPDSDIVISSRIRLARNLASYPFISKASPSDRVEIEKKFSIAVSCVIFVLLGAPIALRFPRGGVGLTIGVSLGVFAIYYVGLLAGEALSDRGLLDPSLAMWSTNALLGAVGVYLTAKLGSEGSTHRGSETSEWWGRTMDRLRTRFKRSAA